ncbi:hypothetical protein E2C01_077935 [Portunus trituberculatus]|uniref:Uncharacterized protein n=1 Tax=Portunus trituberculatus TaxID=210409 RepID=A0A5B7ICN3_PORTR|nr:hypothetical protein [Portunus trituberculatus]
MKTRPASSLRDLTPCSLSSQARFAPADASALTPKEQCHTLSQMKISNFYIFPIKPLLLLPATWPLNMAGPDHTGIQRRLAGVFSLIMLSCGLQPPEFSRTSRLHSRHRPCLLPPRPLHPSARLHH